MVPENPRATIMEHRSDQVEPRRVIDIDDARLYDLLTADGFISRKVKHCQGSAQTGPIHDAADRRIGPTSILPSMALPPYFAQLAAGFHARVGVALQPLWLPKNSESSSCFFVFLGRFVRRHDTGGTL
jgi:hypothetical protein